MPVEPTCPGVYIQESPSGAHTISNVPTSIAAFVDYFKRGPMNTAVQILSLSDFQRTFGGLDQLSESSYALQQFFLNGGTQAHVVRVASGKPVRATVTSKDGVVGGAKAITFFAASEGEWGNNLRVGVEHVANDRFNLIVLETDIFNGQVVIVNREVFRNLSMSPTMPSPPALPGTPDPNYVGKAIGPTGSQLITTDLATGFKLPQATGTLSGEFSTFPGIPGKTSSLQIEVTFTMENQPEIANLGTAEIRSIEEAASRLEAAIRNANLGKPHWAQTTVRVIKKEQQGLMYLQINAGPSSPDAIITFDKVGADTTADQLKLTGIGVKANVAYYRLGYDGAGVGAEDTGIEGENGTPPDAAALIGNPTAVPPTGLYALDKVDIFNILCLPRIARVGTAPDFDEQQVDGVISAATAYCEQRRAFFILDTPNDIDTLPKIRTWLAKKDTLRHRNLALYFPRVQYGDPLNDYRLRSFGASGTMAGVYARTDVERGIWKAPAGTEAVLRNVQSLECRMTDAENGTIYPLGINALRDFDMYGNISWGARTLDGSDQKASDWKYVPVRRLALFIEESLYRGTKWAVFEPNDEPLWAQLRLNISAFIHNLFRQGAFAGSTPREAYMVKCGKETITQNDVNLGIVNIVVGFAPLKPAEFVIIKIQQLAVQIQD